MVKAKPVRRRRAVAVQSREKVNQADLLSFDTLTVHDNNERMDTDESGCKRSSRRKPGVAKRGVAKAARKAKRKLAKARTAGLSRRHKRKNVNRKKK